MTKEPCTDKECHQREFCRLGTCEKDGNGSFVPCMGDSDCPAGTACSTLDICVDPYHPLHVCNDDKFCGSHAQCMNGKCFPLYNPGKPCWNDQDCCK